MAKIEGLDSDGKLIVKVVPEQLTIDDEGNITINNKELSDFLRNRSTGDDAHVILMGSDCGCKCCC